MAALVMLLLRGSAGAPALRTVGARLQEVGIEVLIARAKARLGDVLGRADGSDG